MLELCEGGEVKCEPPADEPRTLSEEKMKREEVDPRELCVKEELIELGKQLVPTTGSCILCGAQPVLIRIYPFKNIQIRKLLSDLGVERNREKETWVLGYLTAHHLREMHVCRSHYGTDGVVLMKELMERAHCYMSGVKRVRHSRPFCCLCRRRADALRNVTKVEPTEAAVQRAIVRLGVPDPKLSLVHEMISLLTVKYMRICICRSHFEDGGDGVKMIEELRARGNREWSDAEEKEEEEEEKEEEKEEKEEEEQCAAVQSVHQYQPKQWDCLLCGRRRPAMRREYPTVGVLMVRRLLTDLGMSNVDSLAKAVSDFLVSSRMHKITVCRGHIGIDGVLLLRKNVLPMCGVTAPIEQPVEEEEEEMQQEEAVQGDSTVPNVPVPVQKFAMRNSRSAGAAEDKKKLRCALCGASLPYPKLFLLAPTHYVLTKWMTSIGVSDQEADGVVGEVRTHLLAGRKTIRICRRHMREGGDALRLFETNVRPFLSAGRETNRQ